MSLKVRSASGQIVSILNDDRDRRAAGVPGPVQGHRRYQCAPRTAGRSSTSSPFSTLTTDPPAQACPKKRYACTHPGCPKTFSTSGHAARHNRIHTGRKPYRCTFPGCHARFSRQDNSFQHYRTHLLGPRTRRRASSAASASFHSVDPHHNPSLLAREALARGTAIMVVHSDDDDDDDDDDDGSGAAAFRRLSAPRVQRATLEPSSSSTLARPPLWMNDAGVDSQPDHTRGRRSHSLHLPSNGGHLRPDVPPARSLYAHDSGFILGQEASPTYSPISRPHSLVECGGRLPSATTLPSLSSLSLYGLANASADAAGGMFPPIGTFSQSLPSPLLRLGQPAPRSSPSLSSSSLSASSTPWTSPSQPSSPVPQSFYYTSVTAIPSDRHRSSSSSASRPRSECFSAPLAPPPPPFAMPPPRARSLRKHPQRPPFPSSPPPLSLETDGLLTWICAGASQLSPVPEAHPDTV